MMRKLKLRGSNFQKLKVQNKAVKHPVWRILEHDVFNSSFLFQEKVLQVKV